MISIMSFLVRGLPLSVKSGGASDGLARFAPSNSYGLLHVAASMSLLESSSEKTIRSETFLKSSDSRSYIPAI